VPMNDQRKSRGVKSAYELALERLEKEGIARPREEAFDEATLSEMAEVRRKAEARLAELEILYRDQLEAQADPAVRAEEEKKYQIDRRRVEDERDRKLEALRKKAAP
jgi:hypothetical protein